MFKNLKRIVYHTPDFPAAEQWYRNLLSTDPVFETPAGVIFQVGDNSLSLVPAGAGGTRISAFWEVDDVDEAFRRMIEMGASPYAEPKNVLTVRIAEVTDPFGNIIGLSGRIPGSEDRTVENRPSFSAAVVSFCRALASREERSELLRPDYFPELFIEDEFRQLLENSQARETVISSMVTRPLYGYFLARSAFIDSVFEQAILDKTPQIVFLGAGYDTRAFYFRDRLGNASIFELDVPATQNHKRAILQENAIAVPPKLSFIPVNFKAADWGEALGRSGFDRNLKSLFVLEGVLYYLPGETVDSLFKCIRENSTAGSCVCFDYMTEKMESLNDGEPFLFWLEKEKISSFLSSHGFDLLEHLDAEEMTARYLTLRDGTVAEEPLSRFSLVLAQRQ